MKVALFGGSFNPVHNGHLKMANELLKMSLVEEVWFIPCGNHAFGKELAPGKDRVAMLNLATRGNPKLKVVDLETKSNEKSFTADTIRLLRKRYSHQFYFVIGADNLKDFDKWHDLPYLQNEVEFILIKRPEYPLPKVIKLKVSKIISLRLTESSTEIRNLIKNKESVSKLVPESVADFICREGLYK